jgi:hypothetical protein
MFCNQCGTEMQPGSNHCPRCGQTMAWPTASLAQSRLQKHLQILGTLWMIVGVLWLLPSMLFMTLGSVAHFVIPGTEEIGRIIGPFLLFVLGGSLLLVGAGGILVGWGLTRRQPWARITAIVIGAVALFHPPFGTALGIYTLWVLLADEGGLEYRRLASAA